MAYADVNFKTKKALKEAVARGEDVGVFQPGPFGPDAPANGRVFLEGPWYPEQHRWYAEVQVQNGKIVNVR